MNMRLQTYFGIALLVASECVFAQPISSTYTDIDGAKCRVVKEDKLTGLFIKKCPGISGLSLIVMNDDDRMSIEVIDQKKKKYELNYWEVITKSLSSLGKKAEWRVTQKSGKLIPIALIVRVNGVNMHDPDHPKDTSFLAVAKIQENAICVTDKVDGFSKNANEKARTLADQSADKICLRAN